MPRNGSGTYTLPSGNPVAAGTLIDATWANNTLNDLANEMTDSLSRSGEGGMLAPFRIADGLQATPGLAFTNEPSTGLYRAGSNDAWLVVGGTQVTQFTTNGMAGRFAAGAVTTPSVTRLGDLNTGIYFPGADEFAIATGGVARMTFDSAGAVAVPGTLSVTGDVTVDTNTLFVDAANNRVGVGTVTPAVKLDVAGGVSIANSDNLTWGGAYGATTPAISGSAGFLAFYPNGSTSGELMRLNATGLGIGTSSPAEKLDVNGAIAIGGTKFFSKITSDSYIWNNTSALNFVSSDGNTVQMKLTASGNLGLGVTPSAWGTSGGVIKAIQAGTGASFSGGLGVGFNDAFIGSNAFYDGSNWKYINTAAAYYASVGGTEAARWYTAPTGTAGNTISFTQAMTLNASGDLLLQAAAPNFYIQPSTTTSNALTRCINTGGTLYVGLDSSAGGLGGAYTANFWHSGNYAMVFATNNTERARITSGGLLLVNTTTSASFGNAHRIFRDVAEGSTILSVDGGSEFAALFYDVAGANYNAGATAIIVGRNTSTLRSINAGGTINASGADYAEYMTKAGDFVIAKGDVCGIDANGKLTNVFADAVSFVVKSTDPSYVGGDSWGAGFKDDPEGLEAARQKVDRIAFAGQVPVNVLGATPGQYIVPVDDNGAIKGVAVSNPTFEQYQAAVGKVIAVQDDGRAVIIVKVV